MGISKKFPHHPLYIEALFGHGLVITPNKELKCSQYCCISIDNQYPFLTKSVFHDSHVEYGRSHFDLDQAYSYFAIHCFRSLLPEKLQLADVSFYVKNI